MIVNIHFPSPASGSDPEDFPELVAINALGDSLGEQTWFFEQAPEEKFPIVFPAAAENPND